MTCIEFDRENDGRWIAEAISYPGVLAYGATLEEAQLNVEFLLHAVLLEPNSSQSN